jgi:Domain of unknown function (DUF4192)
MTSSRQPAAITARSPEDLLAMVPIALGFHPVDSLVMLTFGPAAGFHARIDLPRTPEDEQEVIEALLAPVVQHRVKMVALIAVCPDPRPVLGLMSSLIEQLVACGVEVKDALHSNGDSWSGLTPVGWSPAREFDVSAHPFLADAVVRGEVIHRSRTDLSHILEIDPVAARATAQQLKSLRGCLAHPAGGAWPEWATGIVERVVEGGEPLGPSDIAGLLVAVGKEDARTQVWWMMTRELADAHVDLWTRVVRSAPPGLVATPACLLGFAAWLAGHGALAWCAVDRCREVAPQHPMAGLLDTLLRRAVPPHTWEGFQHEWDSTDSDQATDPNVGGCTQPQ